MYHYIKKLSFTCAFYDFIYRDTIDIVLFFLQSEIFIRYRSDLLHFVYTVYLSHPRTYPKTCAFFFCDHSSTDLNLLLNI